MKTKNIVLFFVLLGLVVYYLPVGRFLGRPEVVTVAGYAEKQEMNQKAWFSAGVSVYNDDKQKAIDEVNGEIQKIISMLKDFGIEEGDIKTQNLSIYQNQEDFYVEGVRKMKPGQWNVNNTVEVTLRDVSKVSELADLLGKSGASNIYGPNFSTNTDSAIGNDLYEEAIKDAKVKAELIAKASDRSLGAVVGVSEDMGNNGGSYARYEGMGGGTPLEPGAGIVSKTVMVSFELK